jgi:hypothetical protein
MIGQPLHAPSGKTFGDYTIGRQIVIQELRSFCLYLDVRALSPPPKALFCRSDLALNVAMFRWLWPSFDQQPAQEEQWIAHREVKDSNRVGSQWLRGLRSGLSDENANQNVRRELSHIAPTDCPGNSSHRSLSCDYQFVATSDSTRFPVPLW